MWADKMATKKEQQKLTVECRILYLISNIQLEYQLSNHAVH